MCKHSRIKHSEKKEKEKKWRPKCRRYSSSRAQTFQRVAHVGTKEVRSLDEQFTPPMHYQTLHHSIQARTRIYNRRRHTLHLPAWVLCVHPPITSVEKNDRA
ncbi:uncharacterized protein LOC116200902 isoform X5 [Punica granatum]|uniref:Uncharacterized protein LOC116200902 isoform X5 n=1 Tax=Punica granatum TaxID=22663 RepID=A0A6P8D271_PUNGR|nr:uncharacterized protein LOC116200902 isoform X5 [Punica granatum]